MSVPTYRDLIWNLAYEGSKRKGTLELRVFSSEQEMYETGWRTTRVFPFVPPPDLLRPLRTSKYEWTHSRVSLDEMMYLGQLLWDSLPQEVKRLPLEAIPDQPCRLKISSNSSAIDDLPWEWLNDGTGLPFALRPQVRLARSVPIRLAMPPMRLEAPLRVLLFTTNPKDERLLHSPREIQAIKPRLSAPPYTLKVLEEPTWGALVAALRAEQPHILHYVGHTGLERGEGNLILHDSNHLSHWISGQDLSWVLPPTVRLLCLGTCFTAPNYQILGLSRLALTSAKYRLPTSVANRYQVTESSVEVFWRAFYSSLAYHGNANEAFYEAQHEV